VGPDERGAGMSGFSGSPRLVKAAIVLVNPASGAVQRTITLQYNPDTLSRTFQIQGSGGGERSEALRLKGPPVESLKLDAEIDATDQLEHPQDNPDAVALGIQPELAALETIAYPSAALLVSNNGLAAAGTIEIVPAETPLTLFVWGAQRTLPVRLTELSVVEEAFDPALNPIRAKVSLGLRVLSVDDLGFSHRGGSLFMAYVRAKEKLIA
jgi:Contractile injection system tube protein